MGGWGGGGGGSIVPRILKVGNDGNAVNSINQGVAIWPWFHAEKIDYFTAFDLAKKTPCSKLKFFTAHAQGYNSCEPV